MITRLFAVLVILIVILGTGYVAQASEVKVAGGNWVWEEVDGIQSGKGSGNIVVQYLGYELRTQLVEWQKNPELILFNQGGLIKDAYKSLSATKIVILPELKQVEFYNVDYSDVDSISVKNAPKVVVRQSIDSNHVYRVFGPVSISVQERFSLGITECFYYPNSLKMLESTHFPITIDMKLESGLLNGAPGRLQLEGSNAVIYRMPGINNYTFKLDEVLITQEKSVLHANHLDLTMQNSQFTLLKLIGSPDTQVFGELYDPSTNETFNIKADVCNVDAINKSAVIEGEVEIKSKSYYLKSNKILLKNFNGKTMFELPERSKISLLSDF